MIRWTGEAACTRNFKTLKLRTWVWSPARHLLHFCALWTRQWPTGCPRHQQTSPLLEAPPLYLLGCGEDAGSARQTGHAGTPRTQTHYSLSTPAADSISSQETAGEQRHTVGINSLCTAPLSFNHVRQQDKTSGIKNHYKQLSVVHLVCGEAPPLNLKEKRAWVLLGSSGFRRKTPWKRASVITAVTSRWRDCSEFEFLLH